MEPARRRNERGIVLPLTALVLTTIIAFCAIAIDLGYQRVARRDMQALADVVALDLSRHLDGRAADDSALLAELATARDQSVQRNAGTAGVAPTVTFELGAVDPTTRAFTVITGATPTPTAVRVTTATSVDYFFSVGSGGATRSAVASQDALANFMIGSFLIGADLDTSLLNRIIPRFLGSPLDDLNITAVGWQGLAAAQINLANFATQLGLGSPNALATAGTQNARGFYLAAAQVMQNQGDTANATLFNTIASTVNNTATLDLGDIFAQQGGSSGQLATGTNVSMPALFFLNSSVFAINGTNLVSIPNFDAGIPGVAGSTLTVSVIEAPQYCITPTALCRVGMSRSTAQVQVRLENTVNLGVPLLAGGLLSGSLITDTTAAGATGTLAAVRCRAVAGIPEGIDVLVTTQPITTTATEHLTVQADVTLPLIGTVSSNVATVDVTDAATVASSTGGLARFDYPSEFLPSVGSGGSKRLGSPDLGISTSLTASGSNVSLLGLPGFGNVAVVANAVNLALAPTVSDINNFVTRRLARTLGVDIGGADVGAVDRACATPILVG